MEHVWRRSFALAWALVGSACGGGGEAGVQADQLGVGAECAGDDECRVGQLCLDQFKGGYCGLEGCSNDADCPNGSACVAHEDGVNYCFRTCSQKVDCNRNRGADVEANCSSNVTFVSAGSTGKACVPPSN
jgi:hypothetical protein